MDKAKLDLKIDVFSKGELVKFACHSDPINFIDKVID